MSNLGELKRIMGNFEELQRIMSNVGELQRIVGNIWEIVKDYGKLGGSYFPLEDYRADIGMEHGCDYLTPQLMWCSPKMLQPLPPTLHPSPL